MASPPHLPEDMPLAEFSRAGLPTDKSNSLYVHKIEPIVSGIDGTTTPGNDFIALEELASDSRMDRNEIALAPVDTGFSAWSFLGAVFIVDALVWSFPFAYGIFLPLYLKDPRFASNPHAATLLPLVGTLSSGVIYCTGPIVYPYLARYPHHRRACAWIGVLLCWSSLFGASYANNIEQLLALQGVTFAIGGSMLYAPCISYLSEWFVKRRGLATGIIFSGSASGGLVLPFILPPILRAHGTSGTLRILSIAIVILLVPAVYFVKPRLPETRVHGPRRRTDQRAWLKDWSWWLFLITNTIVGFAFFIPQLWFPTFTTALNLSPSSTSLALALLNGASALAPLLLGFLSDRFSPWLLVLLMTSLSSFVTFILWGVTGGHTTGIMAYGVAYGLSAGGWPAVWPGFLRGFSKDDPDVATLLYGFYLFTRGIGNVLSSPISTTLSSATVILQSPAASPAAFRGGKSGFDVADGKFGKLIMYVGSCFAAAGVVALVGLGAERARKISLVVS